MSTSFAVAFAHLATSADVERSPAISGGKRGAPTVVFSGVKITRPLPLDADIQNRLGLNTPHERLQSYLLEDQAVREGDILVLAGEKYPIASVEEWPWPWGGTIRLLILEELKR